jgi:hypothetical protein
MEQTISERDWKVLRELKTVALERFCERMLADVSRVAAGAGKGAHERYLEVVTLVDRRRDELANAFDDMRRSRAFQRLASIMYHKLLTQQEFERFSDETRKVVEFYLEHIMK